MTGPHTADDEHPFILDYLPPYDWPAIRGFFATRAIPGVEWCDDTAYHRTIVLAGLPGLLRVRHDARRCALVAQVRTARVGSLRPVAERIRSMFDLHATPSTVHAVLGADPHLRVLVEAAPGLRVPGSWDPFELAVRAILGQQVTVAAARTLATRLVERWGTRPGWDGPGWDGEAPARHCILFPVADALADAAIETIGMPRRRAQTIRALAAAVARGVIRFEAATDWAALREALLRIPGIGEWTVGYLQLRARKDTDAFPKGDIALLRAAQRLAIADTPAQLHRAAEAWRPWRAYAVLHLWRSLAAPPPDSKQR